MRRYEEVSGFVLAGGESSRMGFDKARLEIAGVPMVVRMARLVEPLVASVTVVGKPERYAPLGLLVVPDDYAGMGPAGGLATALRHAAGEWCLIVGCDLPYLDARWLDWLMRRAMDSEAEVLLPESTSGLEPLCAMYRARSAAVVSAAVERGVRKVTDTLPGLAIEKVTATDWGDLDSDGMLFKNMNTWEDYTEARAKLEGKSAR